MIRLRAVLMQAGAGTRPRVSFCRRMHIMVVASSCVRLPQFITRGHEATRLKGVARRTRCGADHADGNAGRGARDW